MKKILVLLFAPLLFVLASAIPAQADSPHFIRASGSINGDGSLTVNFKEAGLGSNQNIDYVLTADGTATYVCVNNGGGNPSAQNKTTVSGPVVATGTFNSGKNGQVTASLTAQPPGPGGFSCPPGQKLQLAQVSYTNVVLTDLTNDESIAVGDISSGCLLPNVRGAC
ncbi:MAG TPA: hypothetical protein VFT95_08350 [Micromonosporaceae bacterium]|nr:hypothetical protein [Micromonosporaceae bacterium]